MILTMIKNFDLGGLVKDAPHEGLSRRPDAWKRGPSGARAAEAIGLTVMELGQEYVQ